MAWTTPGTATAGDVLTAAFWNAEVRDNMVELAPFSAAWTSYTPTLAQGVSTNISKTVNYAKYVRVGKVVWLAVKVSITGAGSAGSSITVSLPVSSAASAVIFGSGMFYDASSNLTYAGGGFVNTGTTVAIYAHGAAGNVVGVSPNIATANGDEFFVSLTYEAA
jgi:hypothetical protein